jgi:hypothetical protein
MAPAGYRSTLRQNDRTRLISPFSPHKAAKAEVRPFEVVLSKPSTLIISLPSCMRRGGAPKAPHLKPAAFIAGGTCFGFQPQRGQF